MSGRKLKALLFDMDGLLIDTERLYIESERELAREFGAELPEVTIARMMGRKPLEAIRIMMADLGVTADPAEVLARRDRMMIARMNADLRPMPGMPEIISRFRGRLALAVATGAVRPFVDLMVTRFGLEGVFDAIQTSEDVERGKPDPEIYLRAAEKAGFPPSECAVLEDSGNGVSAGHTAGCYTVAVPNDHTRGQDFSSADLVCRDLFEAAEALERLLLFV